MALSIGTIKQISGIVMARNASGEDRVLKVGDTLNAEDVISTIGAGSHVVLTLNDGREIVLNGNDNVTLDQSVYVHAQNFADESVVQGKTIEAVSSNQSVEDIQAALLRGEDISTLEATAAGGDTGTGASGGNVVSGFATAQYLVGGNESTVLADQRTLNGTESAAVDYSTTTSVRDSNSTLINDLTDVVNDSVTTDEDTSVIIDVLANDIDSDSKSPVISVTNGTNGTVSINSDGTLTYTPNANFNGTDSFTYTNKEGTTATVSVSVTAVTDGFSDADETVSTTEDTTLSGSVLSGTTSVDGSVSV
ncbi:MAG: retention module-containing protein, partial [Sulfurospirillum cavolei]|nr:retention module-containing protein [Sulfurospirillum cavolei]